MEISLSTAPHQSPSQHEAFMQQALKEAHSALDKNEVPIGAVIVHGGRIIARAHNLTEALNDTTAHAEMQAITAATNYIGGKYLRDCTLYVTLEPCPMCAAACRWAQLSCIVYGASDPKGGYSLFKPSLLHPKTTVEQGILAQECGELLSNFFKQKR
ncbi:MAG: nucleoside deaminase [Bacteroidales bacterium]